jgi:hypothetical protein
MWRGRVGAGLLLLFAAGCGRIGFDTDGGAGGTGVFITNVRFDDFTTAADGPTDPATAPRDGERLQIGDGSCPGYTGQTSQPYRAVLVENAGSQPVTVSAWATCIAGDMAVLSFYQRDTPPVTRFERAACAIGVSERGSPAPGTATPCPAMLASSSRGLPLAVGEKAIVWLQAEGATLPSLLHIEAQ